MATYIVLAQCSDDAWTYGPFETLEVADDFAERAGEKYDEIEYTVTEIFAPAEFLKTDPGPF